MRNPDKGPESQEAGNSELPLRHPTSDAIAKRLIGEIEEGAVPLVSSFDHLEDHDAHKVVDAIIAHPDPEIAESMDAQVAAKLNR